MEVPPVVVFGETPSLAASITELLELDGIPVRREDCLSRVLQSTSGAGETPPLILVSTSTGYTADLLRDWQAGSLRDSELILVGPRDAGLRSFGRLHVARLPLAPDEFITLVRTLLAQRSGLTELVQES